MSTGNIYDKTLEAVQALGLDSECVGGGRIKHDAAQKKILVYGYSQVSSDIVSTQQTCSVCANVDWALMKLGR